MSVLAVMMMAQAADPAMAAASEARTAGRTAEAVAAFEALSRARPADADVWLNLGLSYTAARRYVDAEAALRNALRLAPDYADARLGYARLAYFQGDYAEARRRLAPLANAASNTEVQALLRQVRAAEAQSPPLRLDLAYARSRLTQDLPDWTSLFASVSGRLDPNVTVIGSIEQTERFDKVDTYAEAQVYHRRGNLDGYLAFGFSPNASYRPETALRGGVGGEAYRRGSWSVRVGADGGWARYLSGDVRTLQPYVGLGFDRGVLTLRSINTLDENGDYQSGYALRGDLTATDRLRFDAGWSRAPETSDGRTVEVEATAVGVGLDLTARTSLRLGALWERRDAYDRDEVTIGLTQRF